MPSPTFTPLANITLSGTASSVTFSSISGSYRDLVLVCNLRASTTDDVKMRVNGLTTSIYFGVSMYGTGSVAGSYVISNTATLLGTEGVTTTSGDFSTKIINILDYSATDKHHPVLVRTSAIGANGVTAVAGRIADTAAITSVQLLFESAATFAAGSSFALYGIAS